jgi:xylose isomerase
MKLAFPEISKIPYEGPSSKKSLAFKYYDASKVVEDRTMAEHLRFSVAYWHTFRNTLSDPFGVGTAIRPWDDGSNSVDNACHRARVAFEFVEKLGAPFYAFHDRDVAPEGANLAESNRNLDAVAKVLKEEQHRTGIKLLWATACLFIIRVSCMGRPPAQMPTCLPTQPRR